MKKALRATAVGPLIVLAVCGAAVYLVIHFAYPPDFAAPPEPSPELVQCRSELSAERVARVLREVSPGELPESLGVREYPRDAQ
jgi:hypothetical protein